ncbi:unnamed protein product, partial [Sphacelaria rigidula]
MDRPENRHEGAPFALPTCLYPRRQSQSRRAPGNRSPSSALRVAWTSGSALHTTAWPTPTAVKTGNTPTPTAAPAQRPSSKRTRIVLT